MKPKKFKVTIPIFGSSLVVWVVDKMEDERDMAIAEDILDEDGNGYRKITLSKKANMFSIMHECLHIVDFVEDYYKIDDGEFRAYLLEYLVKTILKKTIKRG